MLSSALVSPKHRHCPPSETPVEGSQPPSPCDRGNHGPGLTAWAMQSWPFRRNLSEPKGRWEQLTGTEEETEVPGGPQAQLPHATTERPGSQKSPACLRRSWHPTSTWDPVLLPPPPCTAGSSCSRTPTGALWGGSLGSGMDEGWASGLRASVAVPSSTPALTPAGSSGFV